MMSRPYWSGGSGRGRVLGRDGGNIRLNCKQKPSHLFEWEGNLLSANQKSQLQLT